MLPADDHSNRLLPGVVFLDLHSQSLVLPLLELHRTLHYCCTVLYLSLPNAARPPTQERLSRYRLRRETRPLVWRKTEGEYLQALVFA